MAYTSIQTELNQTKPLSQKPLNKLINDTYSIENVTTKPKRYSEKSKKHDENAKKEIEKEDTRSTHNKQMYTYSFAQ